MERTTLETAAEAPSQAAFRFPVIFPLAHRRFIAAEIFLRAAALIGRRRRVDVGTAEPRPFRLLRSSAEIAASTRSRSPRNSVKIWSMLIIIS
jgi:hypothetical protein